MPLDHGRTTCEGLHSKPDYVIAVVGSRSYNDRAHFDEIMDRICLFFFEDFHITIISGGAQGADTLAYQYAEDNHISFHEYPAEWEKFKPKEYFKHNPAGMIRNMHMAKDCDECVAFWDGKSPGTKGMIKYCQKHGKPVRIIDVRDR